MFDDEKLAHQRVLDGDHSLEQGWTVEGPGVHSTPTKPKENKENAPARVIQVDTAEPEDLVNGITTAVGQVATEVGSAQPLTLDLNGRPLHVPVAESTNPKVRQAAARMQSCRDTYRTLTPEAVGEENKDINRRLSQKYRTECVLPSSGGTVSKSYYYDSKTIERLELDLKQVLLEGDVPRSTIIEVCRLRDPEDQRNVVLDILDKNLSCRETRQLVQLVVKLRSRPGTEVRDYLNAKLANLLRGNAPFFVRLV